MKHMITRVDAMDTFPCVEPQAIVTPSSMKLKLVSGASTLIILTIFFSVVSIVAR